MPDYTPGPWIVSDSWKRNKRDRVRGKDREILVLAEDLAESSICHVATLEADRPEDIHKREMANAYVISAAPELFEALRKYAEYRDSGMGGSSSKRAQQMRVEMNAAIELAIAKAEGRDVR